jgi:hypothetical protein
VRLGSALWERRFAVRSTSRTWGSVEGLHRVAHGPTA